MFKIAPTALLYSVYCSVVMVLQIPTVYRDEVKALLLCLMCFECKAVGQLLSVESIYSIFCFA